MQVKSKQIRIKKPEIISLEIIEEGFVKQKINPLRWSIVKIEDENIIINVAYE